MKRIAALISRLHTCEGAIGMAEFSKRRFSTLAGAILVATAAGVLWLAVICKANDEKNRSYSKRTRHYEVVTYVDPSFTDLVGRHMEEIYQEYTRRLRGVGRSMKGRFRVTVYKDKEQYEAAVPEELEGSNGAFMPGDKLLATFLGDRPTERVFRTLYHEGFHQFAYVSISPGCPLWVNEGLAEYFAEATWNGRRFRVGQVPPGRVHLLRDAVRRGEYVPFEEMLIMEDEGWLKRARENETEASVQYNQAWSMVHFLVHADDGRYHRRLLKYLRDIARGRDIEEAFEDHFGDNVRAFQRAWKRYVLHMRPDKKYVCKNNIRVLMFLSMKLYDEPAQFDDVGEFRAKLLGKGGLRWSVTTRRGEKLSSDQKRKAAALFRCPFDRSEHEASYRLIRSPRTGLPMLFCTHHRGTVMKGYLKVDSGGSDNYRVVVEEQVDDTVSPAIRRALAGKR